MKNKISFSQSKMNTNIKLIFLALILGLVYSELEFEAKDGII